jgi:hypothetical protein
MIKVKYKYTKDGSVDNKLWSEGWRVSVAFTIFGFKFLKYTYDTKS